MTITERIIAAHAGLDSCEPGELATVPVDLILANDITAPLAIKEFGGTGAGRVFDPDRIVLVCDHFTPNKDVASAEQCRVTREFAREQGISAFFDVGRMGIEHALLPEQGFVWPGDLVVGADSHTCTYGALGAFATGMGSTDVACAMATGRTWLRVPESIAVELKGAPRRWVYGKDVVLALIGVIGVDGANYKALEFVGDGAASLTMDSRFTICNMAIEAGAKNGIFAVDGKTRAYLAALPSGRCGRGHDAARSDPDARYERRVTIDVSALEPQVAAPSSPANVKPVSEFSGVKVDQVVIGSCTNGRMEDLRAAASVMRGRRVADGVRAIVIPATQVIMLQAVREGLVEVLVEAGCAVSTPTCGPCLGGHMGVLAGGETCVATTNRNFVGRMGHAASRVYLSNAAVAAASAVAGRIAHPAEVAKG